MRDAIAYLKRLIDADWAGYGTADAGRTVALDYQWPSLPVEYVSMPDAFFVTRDVRAILDHPETPSVIGAPDVVVEVTSPTTAKHDRPPG